MPASRLPAGTYSVSEFAWEVKGLLGDSYPSVWIAGEVQRLRTAARGQIYFELIEKGRGDRVKAKLDCVVWADERIQMEAVLREAGVELAEGAVLRCAGSPDFWPGGGRFQFVVLAVDPVFSLGALEKRRRETLRWLEKAGLLETNKRLTLPPAPLDIGLITSKGSAAYHDFVSTLGQSGLGFRVVLVHSSVQGASAEAEVARAFRVLAAHARSGHPLDAIALVRGGGSRTDLATFDSRRVARAVAEAPVPTICGIGHQTDKSIADIVAHTSCRTPTETAELLVRQVGDAAARVDRTARELALQARSLVQAAEQRTAAIPHRIVARSRSLLDGQALRCDALRRELTRSAGRSLGAAGRLLQDTRRALGRRAEASVARSGERVRAVASRLPGPGRRFLAQAKRQEQEQRMRLLRNALQPLERAGRQIEAHRRLIDQLSPERTLARGFSLTRRANGRLVRSISDVRHGTNLQTRVADGTVFSHAFGVSRGTDPVPPARLRRRLRVSRRKAVAAGEPRQQSFLAQEEQT